MGASQFCACTVAHIARKKIKVCPTLEAIRRIHLSTSRAMSRMLEHFSCRCRGTKDCSCGFSLGKSHAEYRSALRRDRKSAQAPRSCLTQLTLLLAVLLQFLPAQAQARTPEQRTAANMEQARAAGPLALRAFLAGMPKGGDLHSHLSGAVYAETFLRDAASDH